MFGLAKKSVDHGQNIDFLSIIVSKSLSFETAASVITRSSYK